MWRLSVVLLVAVFLTGSMSQPDQEIWIFGNSAKPPKNWQEDGAATGILVDIMRLADKEMPETFKFKLTPWTRAYKSALSAKGGIIGFSKNEERLEIFDYSDVMYYDDVLLVVRKGSEFDFKNLTDLRGKKIAATRGASYGELFEKCQRDGIFSVSPTNKNTQNLKMLLAGRVDVALAGPGLAGFHKVVSSDPILAAATDEFVVLEKPLVRDPNFLGFSKELQMKGFLERFNKFLKQANESGTIQKIIDRYSVGKSK